MQLNSTLYAAADLQARIFLCFYFRFVSYWINISTFQTRRKVEWEKFELFPGSKSRWLFFFHARNYWQI